MVDRLRWPLVAVVLLALAVRIGFLVVDPHPYEDSGLAAASAEMAREIDDHGRWFESNLTAASLIGTLQNDQRRLLDPASISFRAVDAHPQLQADVLQPIGEAVVLAGLWKVTGSERWLPYQLLMVALGALMTLVVFYIALSLFGRRRAAYLAAALYAVFPPLAWLSTIPHLDAWAVDLTLVITALLVRAREVEKPMRWLVAVGVAVGLGTYFRPGVLLIAPFVALALLPGSDWRRALRFAAIPTLVAAILLVPWTIRNENVYHRFIPTRIGIGQNLWEGLGELPNNFGARLSDAGTFQQVHAVRPDLVYGTPAYDSFLESWAIRAIRNHPGFYIKLMGKRFIDSTALLRNTEWVGAALSPAQSGLGLISYIRQRPTNFLAFLLEPLLFAAAIVTILATRRRFGRSHLFLIAVVVATLFPYLFLHVEPRYILPASFAYLVWTALGIDLLSERLRRGPARESAADRATTAAPSSRPTAVS